MNSTLQEGVFYQVGKGLHKGMAGGDLDSSEETESSAETVSRQLLLQNSQEGSDTNQKTSLWFVCYRFAQ
jgi:hypothetical protein